MEISWIRLSFCNLPVRKSVQKKECPNPVGEPDVTNKEEVTLKSTKTFGPTLKGCTCHQRSSD